MLELCLNVKIALSQFVYKYDPNFQKITEGIFVISIIVGKRLKVPHQKGSPYLFNGAVKRLITKSQAKIRITPRNTKTKRQN